MKFLILLKRIASWCLTKREKYLIEVIEKLLNRNRQLGKQVESQQQTIELLEQQLEKSQSDPNSALYESTGSPCNPRHVVPGPTVKERHR